MKHEFDEITKNCKTSFNKFPKGEKKVNKIYILSNVFGISIFVKVLFRFPKVGSSIYDYACSHRCKIYDQKGFHMERKGRKEWKFFDAIIL